MRVVQVSAHYPPNFVSGGTLVPQRVARHMAGLGHESFVYAGYLDEARAPLETWTEDDGEGVTVRWVVTTPWTAWSDPLNSLNPAVEEDFAGWLAEVRPDVVHLHSLQTLGGGLVRAAKAAGARTVVTMHDFWWTCARQFLTAPDLRPCSIVVDCGGCPCAVDHDWLERRNAALRPMLEHADVVLAPSRSAARVLVANGVDPDRVRVDENGVPGATDLAGTSRPPAPEDGPVRLLYAGGPDPMKGVDVLLAAASRLPQDGSWALDLHGLAGTERELPEGARALPPYRPEDLADVLAAHDVLVLPSVVRESHSILTREALAAGLAVVCTDTLGPEEAVAHDVNGLVVPAGEVEPLTAALARLAADPAAVRRMQDAGLQSPLRELGDQLDGLDRLYRELATGSGPAGASTGGLAPTVRAAEDVLLDRVLVVVGIQGAPLRYRGRLPAEALRMHGREVELRHYRDPALPGLALWADAVVLYRVPATRQVVDLVASVRARPRAVPVLFDIDDLIFDPSLEGEVHGLEKLSDAERTLWWRGVARYRTTMELCDAYVGSTEALCRHATEVTGLPAFRFANGVGRRLARISDAEAQRPRADGPLRIGYFSGTKTHDADWAVVEPAVAQVLRDHPDVELWLGGLLSTGPALEELADRVVRLPMLPWTELPGRLRDVDVNLAPLVLDSRFNEAKSAIKWLEAALVETPTVATPTQPFVEAVEHGRTGFLATTTAEWVEAITALLEDPLLRRRVGTQARREALLRWGPHAQAETYLQLLRDVARHVRDHGPRVATGWEPVVDDEPLSAAESWLEPDGTEVAQVAPPSAVADRLGRSGAGRRLLAARHVYTTAGPAAVARKAVQVARRQLQGGGSR